MDWSKLVSGTALAADIVRTQRWLSWAPLLVRDIPTEFTPPGEERLILLAGVSAELINHSDEDWDVHWITLFPECRGD